jgi:Phasin protein
MLSADGNKPTGKPGQRKRKGDSKKAEARKRKTAQETAQPQDLKADQSQDDAEAVSTPVISAEDALSLPVESSQLAPETTSEPAIAIESSPTETLAAEDSPVMAEAATTPVVSTELPSTGLAAIDWSSARSPDTAAVSAAEATPAASVEIVHATEAEAAPVNYQTIANAYGDLTRRSFDQTTSFFEKFWGVRSFDKVFELQTEFAKQAYDSFVAESQRIRDLHREMTRQRLQRWEGFVGMSKPR